MNTKQLMQIQFWAKTILLTIQCSTELIWWVWIPSLPSRTEWKQLLLSSKQEEESLTIWQLTTLLVSYIYFKIWTILTVTGAVPKLHGSRAVSATKEQFNLQNHDIERSAPRQLHIGLNKPENCMKTDDIAGAKPQCVKFRSTRFGQNPLNPKYNLQSVTFIDPEPIKFIRD